jgi:pimeloyl-ACP methyl ester carboxylesterase
MRAKTPFKTFLADMKRTTDRVMGGLLGHSHRPKRRRTGQFQTIECGSGRPLVMLHGMMGAPENWRRVFPHLPKACHARALRFPFFEDKTSPNKVPTTTAYVRDYLDAAGLDRVVLAGNSLGGHVALHLALEMPQRVAGLILTASSGLFERQITGHQGANPSRQWYHDKMCEIFYDPALVTDKLVDDVVALLQSRQVRRDLVSIAKSAKRDNLADRLGEIRCPVLLIWGRQDEITPPEVAEEFHEKLADSELVWLDRCRHAPMMEHPREFGQFVSAWWRRRIVPQPVPTSRRRKAAPTVA